MFSNCEPSITDWIQAISVPVSVFISYLVFKTGVTAEKKKFAREKEFESIDSTLNKLSEIERLLSQHLNNTDKAQCGYTAAQYYEAMREFNVGVNRCSSLSPETHDELADISFGIHSASTSHAKFADPTKIKGSEKAVILSDTGTQIRMARKRIESIRSEFLRELRK